MPKGQPITSNTHLDREPAINRFFKAAMKIEASDLHLKVGMVPKMRIQGVLKNTTGEALTQKMAEQLVFEILSEDQKKLSVVTFWLFVVALFSWVIPFTVLFVLGMMGQAVGGAGAFGFAITPSLLAFVVTAVLCVIVYYAYKRLVLKI